jgi:anthranilate phosphoribosyltransferase
MREKASRIYPDVKYSLDTCGTGGSGLDTFNISTAAAFIAAAAGINVAKHGNRAATSKSGSADVLEALGIKVDLEPYKVEQCIEEIGMGFMFARVFHKSMKFAAGPRKELGIKTIFNILGPLTNPANANAQIMGVFDETLTETLIEVLENLGLDRAMVVHGMDGMDEITTTDETKISELKDGKITTYYIKPEDFGIKRASIEDLTGGDANENASIIEGIFFGSDDAKSDIVILNAAAALYIGKAASSIENGIEMAKEIIKSGKAMAKVKELAEFSSNI